MGIISSGDGFILVSFLVALWYGSLLGVGASFMMPCRMPHVHRVFRQGIVQGIIKDAPTPKTLAFQNTRLPVCTQLDPFGRGKNPSGIFGLMPVAGQEPVSRFVRMALARPLDEALLDEIIVLAQGCGFDDAIVVGCPSCNQRIE